MRVVKHYIDQIGAYTLNVCALSGNFTLFFWQILKTLFTSRLKISKYFFQSNRIGVESFPIIVLTGGFAGMVFALQSYIGFQRVGGEQFIGAVVALEIG